MWRKKEEKVIDEKDCSERINALTLQDWQPLLALIPEIENTSKFGEWVGGGKNKEGVFYLPHFVPAPIVSKFLDIVYDIPIIIRFARGS